ncbi:hypothetical protein ALC57_01082 [Trachymyrmex cornetzi]|uniref:Uncharacterized protein n=1 Tax=Trachymyrmex cornetzi TaxID=471704 RepID=A0A151JQF6_9HYME|nr:hypothetical protein ALC57_01082 [Trachymyrmex cornetzi]
MIPLNPEKPGKAEGGDLEALCQKLEEKRGEKCGRNRDCNAGLKLICEPPLITPSSSVASVFPGNEIYVRNTKPMFRLMSISYKSVNRETSSHEADMFSIYFPSGDVTHLTDGGDATRRRGPVRSISKAPPRRRIKVIRVSQQDRPRGSRDWHTARKHRSRHDDVTFLTVSIGALVHRNQGQGVGPRHNAPRRKNKVSYAATVLCFVDSFTEFPTLVPTRSQRCRSCARETTSGLSLARPARLLECQGQPAPEYAVRAAPACNAISNGMTINNKSRSRCPYITLKHIVRNVRETNLIRQHGEASPFVSARVNIVQERAVAAFERQEFRSVGSRILPMVKRKGTDYRTGVSWIKRFGMVQRRKEERKGEIKSSLANAVEYQAEAKGKTSRPLLREIGFAEISFIVLAVAVEFLERTPRTGPENRLNDS